MDEQVITILNNILEELKESNQYLNIITRSEFKNPIGLWDIHSKLDEVDLSIQMLDIPK